MTTTVTTRNPVRSDLPAGTPDPAATPTRSRAWAFAGVGSSVLLAATIVTSTMVDVVYRDEFHGTVDGVAAALGDKTGVMFVLHTVGMLAAVLLLVFAAGLHRRLRDVAPDSLAPMIAFAGLAGTAVVAVMGAGLDTEFMTTLGRDEQMVSDPSAAMYNHWIGTIPWLWTLAGLAGLALFAVARQGGVPRWIGRVGLVLGGLTLLLGISPLEYMAGPVAFLFLLPVSLGLAFGDRTYAAGGR
jgi:hypothetical protein